MNRINQCKTSVKPVHPPNTQSCRVIKTWLLEAVQWWRELLGRLLTQVQWPSCVPPPPPRPGVCQKLWHKHKDFDRKLFVFPAFCSTCVMKMGFLLSSFGCSLWWKTLSVPVCSYGSVCSRFVWFLLVINTLCAFSWRNLFMDDRGENTSVQT